MLLMAAISINRVIAGMTRAIVNPRENPFLRLAYVLILITLSITVLSLLISLAIPGFASSRQLMSASQLVAAAVGIVLMGAIGLIELKRAGTATGKTGFMHQMAHILIRVFLYIFLPCIILTGLVVLWAVLTHQSSF